MRVQCVVRWIAVVGTFTSWSSRAAIGQELTLAPRTPRFFYAASTAAKPVEIDVGHSAVLGRVMSLHVERATIGGLLVEIQRQTGLTFAYDRWFPASRPITLEAEAITVAAALGAILVGTGVDVVLTRTGHVWLTESKLSAPRAQEGAIVGTVTDKQRGDPIVGATVVVDPGRQMTTTGSDGRYRLAKLVAGRYTVRARYVGYTSLAASVTVSANEEATVDFPLEKSPVILDELVTVTPGGMQTEVKALPSPVSVITAEDIERQGSRSLHDVFRQAVPSAVAFDKPHSPVTTYFALRGASTLDAGSGQVKIFVDGIETANLSASPVDPASIERMEVIRGPQAATIYGPDAAGGVIQIFTKRGQPGHSRPQIAVRAEAGVQQTPYVGFNEVLRQNYNASVHGGTEDAAYTLGVSYSRVSNWLPGGQPSTVGVPGVFGGLQFQRGIVSVDLSGRYLVTNNYLTRNPLFTSSGVASLYPDPSSLKYINQTFGARLGITPTGWWRNQLTVGTDLYSLDQVQPHPKLTTPADTLLQVGTLTRNRVFASYNSSLRWTPTSAISGTLTAGVDYYRLPATNTNASRTLNTIGTILLGPGGRFGMSRDVVTNTGYFAQLEMGLQEHLFLSAGLRADDNSALGPDFGSAVSPRLGMTYNHELGEVTLRLRSSYGRAIRAPAAGQAAGLVTASDITLPNALLAPERQRGWDGGLDIVFGTHGSLGVTVYDQIADNLIVFVPVAVDPVPTYQFQNVGQVKNRGIELEGRWILNSRLQLGAQYAYTYSRIDDLGPNFTGDERVKDRPRDVPAHTAGGSFTFMPWRGTTLTSGATYVGGFREYDYLAEVGCFGGTQPCPDSFNATGSTRDFVVVYPGFVKVNAVLTQQFTPYLLGFLSVRNLTDNTAYENFNLNPVQGRFTSVGVQLRY